MLARACGHTHLGEFCADDLTTFDRDMAHLTDISFGGSPPLIADGPAGPWIPAPPRRPGQALSPE